MEEKTENTAPKQRGRPFVKGQSGNPKGKPKGSISITQAIKKELRRRDPASRKTWLEIYVRRTREEATKDPNSQAAKLIWNYVDGLPLQRTELSGDSDKPIIINMIPAGTVQQEDNDDAE